jgi:caa(3)-type oxidase subunit IV
MSQDNKKHDDHAGHHILSDKTAFNTWIGLLVLTFITVAVAQIDLGALNFTVAMLVASVKASIVCMFFMGLKYDDKENTVIFSTSLIFLSVFMILTFGDLLTRGDIKVKGSIIPEGAVAQTQSKFQKAWVSSPELIAHGKEQFKLQCATCHGDAGAGNGIAAAGLNPKPRNFTVTDGWKNGRKPSQIFTTLTKGLNTMPVFNSLPAEDRWAIAHYVRTFGAHENEKDSAADLAKVGVDPTKADGGGGSAEKSIPVDVAIDIISNGK